MAKQTDLDCSGCKISMFCSRKDKQDGQPCETDLRAVVVAFVIPLVGIVLMLFLAQGRVGEAYLIALLFFLALTVPMIQNLGVTILQARNQMKFRALSYQQRTHNGPSTTDSSVVLGQKQLEQETEHPNTQIGQCA